MKCIMNILALAAGALAQTPAAIALEPPAECDISRGAWCIIGSGYTITYSGIPGEEYSQWTIYADYWASEPAVIIESDGCRKDSADDNSLIASNNNALLDDKLWREVVVQLGTDGSCTLRLMAQLILT